MTNQPLNVLFLCTGNSARSILAEKLVERWGDGKFQGFSAGSHPKGEVHPRTLAMLEDAGLPTDGLRSKSWDEFAQPGAPVMDFVFTVCDDAAGEICPVWPGQPMTAHWGVPDPASATGTDLERTASFRTAFRMLETRIKLFASLPFAKLEQASLRRRVQEIGRIGPNEGEGSAA
ncbi:arsenate reductase ArsC [Acidiphilium iwatense]|uniref:Arsenate reductase ArsC n=1 Tax=Acidiphilium iwatense TaxID=768198 RepID=A0ABS9E4T5_9PROT|nr:arsenate reductase ArsC [Acidiphilium iwatense]MCF3948941.1 arsenate reductase ArsC [Acidiphilium iwatense]